MNKSLNIADLPEFDITEHLSDEAAIAEYLSIMAEDNDASMMAAALGDIARALGFVPDHTGHHPA